MKYPFLREHNSYYGMGPFDGGIQLGIKENELPDNKSPDMLNMIMFNGVLKKRDGQKYLFNQEGGYPEACLSETFYDNIIYLADRQIKAYNTESKGLTVLKRNVEGETGSFFSYNGYVYYIGGGNYIKISENDGELSVEEVEGYIPNAYINCDKNGVGDSDEEMNYLTGKFRASFSTEADMNYIIIPGGDIDYNAGVEIEYNGNIMPKGRYTLAEGNKVNFSGITFSEGHNNLIVTATSADSGEDRAKITFCRQAAFFGGSSSGLSEGTRIFIAGNKDYANTFFKSELKNPEYFPLSGFDILGDFLDPITGFGKQNGSLVIFKKNSIYLSNYNYSSGETVFTITNISAEKGCDYPQTIAYADNRLIWFHSRWGVMMLSSLGAYSKCNVSVISGPVNSNVSRAGLIRAEKFPYAAAFSYKNRYYLSAGSYCYVLDFSRGIYTEESGEGNRWYLFSDISFSCHVKDKNKLYYGCGSEAFGYFDSVLYDFYEDNPIKAHYVTKAINFGIPSYFKTIKNISFVLRADCNSSAELSVYDEDGLIAKPFVHTIKRFSFINFSFPDFTFFTNTYSVVIRRKVPRRRVKYFKIKFKNELPSSDMAISSLTVEYQPERGVKYNGI